MCRLAANGLANENMVSGMDRAVFKSSWYTPRHPVVNDVSGPRHARHAIGQTMPKTYESTAKGRAALAHLHYFIGGCDWWIVEKDADPDHAGQVQAFGIADLGMGAELGYISIPELLENGAALDLYYTDPKTIGELLA